jgi:uncharacterized alkaline shock family protein YloU
VAGETDPPQGRRTGARLDRATLARSVRSAAAECYGVTAIGRPRWYQRVANWLRPGSAGGVEVALDGRVRVTLDMHVAAHVPTAQVAANVSDAVHYRVLRDFGRPIDELVIRVDGRPIAVGEGRPTPGGGS